VIFKSLHLKNFRQYSGEQTLTFSSSKDRNVTVVYGANGAGKTALLNAFTWVLYGTHTPAFEHPDDLINHGAWAGAKPGEEVEARVTLTFEDGDQTYTVERVSSARKDGDGKRIPLRDGDMSLHFIDESGRDHVRENPERAVRQILPERLHSFFFFDGERIEKLASEDAFSEIEDAIKTILGLEIIERSIRHLDDAGQELGGEAAEVGSDEDRRLNEDLRQTRVKLEELRGERDQISNENRARRSEIDRIYAELAGRKEAQELQMRREALEAELRQAEEEITKSKRSIAGEISRRGHLAFIEGLANAVGTKVDERRTRGEIPSEIKLQLIQDLLSEGQCICGRELSEGSDPYSCVEDWKSRAGDGQAEDAWIEVGAQARFVYGDRDRLYEYLHETAGELERYRARKRSISEQLDEIKVNLGSIDSEEIRKLEQHRERLGEELHRATMRLGGIENEHKALESQRTDIERELEKAEAKSEKAKLAKRRVAVAREARTLLQETYDGVTAEVRANLDGRIAGIFAGTSYKGYEARLTEGFQLRLTKSVDGTATDVPRSSGESQILSLSFVGAIADYARERSENHAGGDVLENFSGGIYPIVMDSPFGKLDTSYQRRIADVIPKLAPQVIVMVSKSQGLGAVQEVLSPRVGKQILIQHSTPDPAKAETIELPTGTHPFVLYDGGTEWARIEDI